MAVSRSAVRTIQILELIASRQKGITLSEISNELNMPVTSVNDIVKALLEADMVELIDERSKLYGIGVKSFYIGSAFLNNTSLVDKARPIVDELAFLMKKTVFLGNVVQNKMTYIYKCEPKDTLVATCSIGSQTELYCTSLGKCILANDESLLEKVLHMDMIQKTPYTITNPQRLLEEIKKVRALGYATDNREQNPHLFCIGAPIFGHDGKVLAALSISGLYSDDIDVEYEGNIIKDKANEISKKMGYLET